MLVELDGIIQAGLPVFFSSLKKRSDSRAPKLIAEYLFSPEAATKVGNKLVESSLEMLEGARDLREFNELKEEDLNMEVEDDTE